MRCPKRSTHRTTVVVAEPVAVAIPRAAPTIIITTMTTSTTMHTHTVVAAEAVVVAAIKPVYLCILRCPGPVLGQCCFWG